MRKLFGILFVFISMGSGITQGKMAYAQCGPVAQSLHPQVLAIAKPIGKTDSIQIPLIIDGDTLGFAKHERWQFQIEQHISGFCKKQIELPVLEDDKDLLQRSSVILELVNYKGGLFADLSIRTENSAEVKTTKAGIFSATQKDFGKLLRIKKVFDQLDLHDFGIYPPHGDSSYFGYDTAKISDEYYQLTFETQEGIENYYSRKIEFNEITLFVEAESYLFEFKEYDGKNWIVTKNIFRKNYHLDEYFEAYERK